MVNTCGADRQLRLRNVPLIKTPPVRPPTNYLSRIPYEILVHIVWVVNDIRDLRNFVAAWPTAEFTMLYPGLVAYWAHKTLVQKFESLHRDPSTMSNISKGNVYPFRQKSLFGFPLVWYRTLEDELYESSRLSRRQVIRLDKMLKYLQEDISRPTPYDRWLATIVPQVYIWKKPVVENGPVEMRPSTWRYYPVEEPEDEPNGVPGPSSGRVFPSRADGECSAAFGSRCCQGL